MSTLLCPRCSRPPLSTTGWPVESARPPKLWTSARLTSASWHPTVMSPCTPNWWKLSALSTRSTSSRLTTTRSSVSGLVCARSTVRANPGRLWAAAVWSSRTTAKSHRPRTSLRSTSSQRSKVKNKIFLKWSYFCLLCVMLNFKRGKKKLEVMTWFCGL